MVYLQEKEMREKLSEEAAHAFEEQALEMASKVCVLVITRNVITVCM